MPKTDSPAEPKKLLEQNIAWFAIGLVVAGAIGAVTFLGFLDKRIDEQIAATLPSNLDRRLTDMTDKASSAETAATTASTAVSELQSASDVQVNEFTKQIKALDTRDKQLAVQIKNVAPAEPADLTPLQTAIDTHSHNGLGNRVTQLEEALLHGAVVAFDRSERGQPAASGFASGGGGACPPGWSLFREAGGRAVIGAGQHQNQDQNGNSLKTYPAYADNKSRAVGGAERHTLKPANIPAHIHKGSTGGDARGTWNTSNAAAGGGGYQSPAVSLDNRAEVGAKAIQPIPHHHDLTTDGGEGLVGAAYDHMIPFIALYFCKYDGSREG